MFVKRHKVVTSEAKKCMGAEQSHSISSSRI